MNILNDKGQPLDPELLGKLKGIPKRDIVIAADLHWTLCKGGEVPCGQDLALFSHITETTDGGFVIISNSDVSDLDKELAPNRFPIIGRGHIQTRLDPRKGIEPHDVSETFDHDSIRMIRGFLEFSPGFTLRFVPPYIDFSIKMNRDLAVSDHEQRLKLLDQVYVYVEAYFVDIPTVTIERGFDYLYVSHGRPDKAKAITTLLGRYPGRTLIGFGDEVSKEGPMLRAIRAAGGYAFYVASPFNYNRDRSYTHETLAGHKAAVSLLRLIFSIDDD